ncbi:MAG: hypothetical protein ABIB47_05540 [Candidatus Woesearchaeota archaeon]
MQIKKLQEIDSNLLSRKELDLEATYDKATPSKVELKKQIASALKVKEELIAIKKIHQIFGTKKAKIKAYLYKDEKLMKKLEAKKEKKKKEEKKAKEKK